MPVLTGRRSVVIELREKIAVVDRRRYKLIAKSRKLVQKVVAVCQFASAEEEIIRTLVPFFNEQGRSMVSRLRGLEKRLDDESEVKHLPGQHNQSTHGRGGGGSGSSGLLDKLERESSRLRSEDRAKEKSEKLISSRGELSRDEKEDVVSYTAASNYKRVNAELRQGKRLSQVEPPPNSSALQKLASQKLGRPTIVYRGMNEKKMETLMGKNPVVGTEIKMKGFVSTTLSPEVGVSFAKMGGALMEIRAKTGVPIGDVSKYKEWEVVQAHGVKYRFVGKGEKKIRGGSAYMIHMFEEI